MWRFVRRFAIALLGVACTTGSDDAADTCANADIQASNYDQTSQKDSLRCSADAGS